LLVQRALKAATPTLGDVAERMGVSYDAVRSWSIGRSSPKEESVSALAELLDRQADVLRGIAAELRDPT
jgi:transcriptional regulator with XRE-family HTH domain